MDMSEYKNEFIDEAEEHLQTVGQALLDLEKTPGDLSILDIIFRAAHTLKSSSAAMEFTHISNLTHEMENVLDVLRSGTIVATSETVDVLFESIDILGVLVNDISEDRMSQIDLTLIITQLKLIIENTAKNETNSAKDNIELNQLNDDESIGNVNDDIDFNYNLTVYLDKECVLKSIRALMVIKIVEDFGEITDMEPSREKIEDGEFDLNFGIFLNSSEDLENIMHKINSIPEVERVDNVLPDKTEKQTESVEQNQDALPETVALDKIVNKSASASQNVKSIRVHIEMLDEIMNLVGELVINKIRLMQISDIHKLNDLKESTDQLNILTTNLQDQIMKMRLVPMEQVFNRFPRMTRDLSKKIGKKIELVIKGSDIELDRTVLDEIGEPLVHLLRNSIDHGIEMPAERQKLGKDETGKIVLTALRDKQNVIIKIEDDGKGLNPKKLRDLSVEKGLMSKEDVEKLNDEESFNLIFMAGFTTAKQVSDISGRGVGMDVVRSKIYSLGGTIKIESELGIGTTVSLQLPISMAIIQALIVGLNNRVYAIPFSSVISTLNVKQEQMKTIQGQKVIVVQDKTIPLLDLCDLFDEHRSNLSDFNVVIVEKNNQQVGLIVDTLIDQHEIVIKSFDKTLRRVEGFSGATILGDGNVVLIMDVDNLLNLGGNI